MANNAPLDQIVGRSARETFLGRVSQGYGHGRMPARVARFVTPALDAAFPPPPAIPTFPGIALDPEVWSMLVEHILPMSLPINQHPVEGCVRNTQFFLFHFLRPIVAALNRRTRPRRFQLDAALPIRVDQQAHLPITPRIHVVGRVGTFITRDQAPCCLIHLTRGNASMDEAAARVLLYTAAQGHHTDQPRLLAVATDLARWRFFLVTQDGYSELPERRVTFLPNGSPVLPELASVLEELASLIAHAI